MSAPLRLPTGGKPVSVPPGQARIPPASRPKTHYVPPNAGVASSAWTAAGTFLDFEIPSGVGVLRTTMLRLDVTNSNASLTVPPSPFMIQQIEVYVGSQLLETLYPNDIYNEACGFNNYDDALAEYAVTNYDVTTLIANTAAATTTPLTGVAKAGNFSAYIPFNNLLTCCRFYCDGVKETIKFRVYFPVSMFANTTSLGAATLVIGEDCGTANDRRQWDMAASSGVVYSTVARQRMNTSITKTSTDYTLELTGVTGSSAGFFVYASPVVVPGTNSVTWYPFGSGASESIAPNRLLPVRFTLKSLELDDQMGNKRTEKLQADDLKSFVWPSQIGTSFAALIHNDVYPLAFCENMYNAITTGVYCGHLKTNGRDRLVIEGDPHNSNAGNTNEVWSVTVTNYTYQALVVRNNSLAEVLRNPHTSDL
jgi:hypothetical protein